MVQLTAFRFANQKTLICQKIERVQAQFVWVREFANILSAYHLTLSVRQGDNQVGNTVSLPNDPPNHASLD